MPSVKNNLLGQNEYKLSEKRQTYRKKILEFMRSCKDHWINRKDILQALQPTPAYTIANEIQTMHEDKILGHRMQGRESQYSCRSPQR